MDHSDTLFFEIGRSETRLRKTSEAAGAAFAHQRALLCRNGLERDLQERLSRASKAARFVSDQVRGLGHRWIEKPANIGAAIELAINRPVLHTWLKDVTGIAALGRAEGRLVETRAGGIDQLDWHDDRIPGARLGITVHLPGDAYLGGSFELRDKSTREILFRHAQAQAGDVVIFDVSSRSEHRVTPVDSGAARLVYTGWFIDSAST